MTWKSKRKATIDWRAYLTKEEAATVARYDAVNVERASLSAQMMLIRNRAINRAKYRAKAEGAKVKR
jgi:hypothetical protein